MLSDSYVFAVISKVLILKNESKLVEFSQNSSNANIVHRYTLHGYNRAALLYSGYLFVEAGILNLNLGIELRVYHCMNA